MSIRLRLLDSVTFDGARIPSRRTAAVLAALATQPSGMSYDRLTQAIWDGDPPANPVKSLQVLVSRARSATCPAVVEAQSGGYRLGLHTDEVDVLVMLEHLDRARKALADGDAGTAVREAQAARAFEVASDVDDGPLSDVRAQAMTVRDDAAHLLGRALALTGDFERALPLLRATHAAEPDDADTFAALLRALAATDGPAAALSAYADYRADLADRLGVDPAPELRKLHEELLARDRPVRHGLRYGATELIGRDDDVAALRALVNTARVTSIVGAGGLGKTRLAHLIGRLAEQPVVHFVELAAVSSGQDVVGEVGSVLGVRESVAGRRVLTPEQRADVRTRIADHLARAPTLLILDNCEHVVEEAAELAAFLVATVPDLRILCTSRAALNIAAERVYALGQLSDDAAAQLFRQRATAARPGVALPDDVVGDLVRRLDGLPLALELAAAKVRAMSVADIARRLENRFTLLAGGDRSAPDRHQTLLAVIDWSWNLLSECDKRAMRRLAIFHDGFSLEAAEAMVSDDAFDAVAALAEQSLLVVDETDAGVRYRMLETVREFGIMQLVDAGEDADARAAQRDWAVAYATEHGGRLYSRRQVEAMAMLRAEDNNLTDVLRQALDAGDREAVVSIFAALCGFWSIGGDHVRAIQTVPAVKDALVGWRPPEELADGTRFAVCLALVNAAIASLPVADSLRRALIDLGEPSDPLVAAMVTAVLALADPDREAATARMQRLADSPDPDVAFVALRWLTFAAENGGDIEAGVALTERSLRIVNDEHGPWNRAMLHSQLAGLYAQLGLPRDAERHARAALPSLEDLGAADDVVQLKSTIATSALLDGRLEDAERLLDEIEDPAYRDGFGTVSAMLTNRAQLAIARGDVDEGLRLTRASVDQMRGLRLIGDASDVFAPWVTLAEAIAVSVFAQFAEGSDGEDLYRDLLAKGPVLCDPERRFMDLPNAGVLLYGVGMWGLLRDALTVPDAVRLLVLARRFAYQRFVPSLGWDAAVEAAEKRAPGLLEEIDAEYGDRRGPALVDEARGVLDRVAGPAER